MKPIYLLLATTLAGCLLPITREQFIADATFEVCTEERMCGDIGEGEDYETFEDCIDSTEDVFDGGWPEDDCAGEDFDRDAYRNCVDDAREAACDDGFFDTIDAFESCRASSVCTD